MGHIIHPEQSGHCSIGVVEHVKANPEFYSYFDSIFFLMSTKVKSAFAKMHIFSFTLKALKLCFWYKAKWIFS